MPKKAQIDKFREKARELETDENEGRFNEQLRRVAKAAPQSKAAQKPDNKKR